MYRLAHQRHMQAAPNINKSPAEAIVTDLQTSYHLSNKPEVKPAKIQSQLHQVKWTPQSIWKVFCFNSSMDLREILLTKGSCSTSSHKVEVGTTIDRCHAGPLSTHCMAHMRLWRTGRQYKTSVQTVRCSLQADALHLPRDSPVKRCSRRGEGP